MNAQKWRKIYNEEISILASELQTPIPESWIYNRSILMNFIEEIDKLTEVYNMDNKENK